MEYQHYYDTAQRVSQLVEAGEYDAAATVLQSLLSSDISDLDKAKMCVNMAIVHDKMGQPKDALAWYDKGIVFERRYSRFYAAEHKATYLAAQGRLLESLRIYEDLLRRPYLEEGDKDRVRANIQFLKAQDGLR